MNGVFQTCPLCSGSGINPVAGSYSAIPICPVCNGAKIISMVNGLPPGSAITKNVNCETKDILIEEKKFKSAIRFALKKRLADPECILDDIWNAWVNENNL